MFEGLNGILQSSLLNSDKCISILVGTFEIKNLGRGSLYTQEQKDCRLREENCCTKWTSIKRWSSLAYLRSWKQSSSLDFNSSLPDHISNKHTTANGWKTWRSRSKLQAFHILHWRRTKQGFGLPACICKTLMATRAIMMYTTPWHTKSLSLWRSIYLESRSTCSHSSVTSWSFG